MLFHEISIEAIVAPVIIFCLIGWLVYCIRMDQLVSKRGWQQVGYTDKRYNKELERHTGVYTNSVHCIALKGSQHIPNPEFCYLSTQGDKTLAIWT